MTKLDENEKELRDSFNLFRSETETRIISNSENFDKAIITLASSGLAVSLSFLKDFVPIERAELSWLLYLSWFLFTCSITTTLISFYVSNLAQFQAIENCRKHILSTNHAEELPEAKASKYIAWFNNTSGIAFILALTSTVFFVSVNLAIASKYKEGQCKDSAGVYSECDFKNKKVTTDNHLLATPSQNLQNEITISNSNHKSENLKPDKVPKPVGDTLPPSQNLQNSITIFMPASKIGKDHRKKTPCPEHKIMGNKEHDTTGP
jgi:hypothetical protein